MSLPPPTPNYRLRFLSQLFRALLLPPLITSLIPLPTISSLLLCILSIPLTISLRTLWLTRSQKAAAKRLNARLVTSVRGRYPGNIDIMFSLIKQHKSGYIVDFHRKLFEEYGELTLNLRILWEDTIITIDEAQVKFILVTRFDNFPKGNWVQEKSETFLGNGIFNRDGEEWKAHRSLTRPFFARERISDFHIFDKYADEALRVLARASAQPYSAPLLHEAEPWEYNTTPVDVQDLFARFTIDSASAFLFAECTKTLKGPLPVAGHAVMGPKGSRTYDEFGSFAAAFEEAQTHVTLRFRYGNLVWPLMEVMRDKVAEPACVIRAWLDPIVQRAVDQRQKLRRKRENNVDVEDAEHGIFLEHLAESTDDKDYIKNELLNILLAARDTTAALITFTVYFLAMHPDVMARLRAEVLETTGAHGTPSYAVMRRMKYMRAVLNETLRIFPSVPVNNRQSSAATVLPSTTSAEGLYVPAQTPIVFLTLLIHRRADLWGADAGVFDPERWIDERVGRFTENPLMFVPFHAGPRICLGQNFAYNEASYFLIKMLQQYDACALAPDAQPEASRPPRAWQAGKGRQAVEKVWPASAMTLYAKGGLWVRMRKAE